MRKPIIAANWKMNKGPKEAEDFIATFTGKLDNITDQADVVIAPPFVTIPAAVGALSPNSDVSIAAQNVSQQDNGAFTGEVSTMMLKELFVRYVIIGHSERRTLYGASTARPTPSSTPRSKKRSPPTSSPSSASARPSKNVKPENSKTFSAARSPKASQASKRRT